nr:hypothetical protein Iba_chr03eCG2800 [Ipomoea batatas]
MNFANASLISIACCIVNLWATFSWPACALRDDKAHMRSWALQPIKLAALVTASPDTASTWFSLSITSNDIFPSHNTAESI